ncbi:unnamed protein product [Somion occarium]|uniref:Uncharacterized protein n=2 Tax=Somion occarium TaxID=3059160 RepID=A0ABP1DJ62_9APHY
MLSFLTRSSDRPKSTDTPLTQSNGVKDANVVVDAQSSNGHTETAEKGASKGEAGKEADLEPKKESQITQDASSQPYTEPTIETMITPHSDRSSRRSLWRLPFLGAIAQHEARKPSLSAVAEHDRKRRARNDFEKYEKNLSRSEKRAHESAVVVRTLIVGPFGIVPTSAKTKPLSKAKLAKVKSELIHPKSANKVIAQLRAMPSGDNLIGAGTNLDGSKSTAYPRGPIHAVCLAYTDEEAHQQHFRKLKGQAAVTEAVTSTYIERTVSATTAFETVASVTNASVTQLTEMFSELKIVSLIASPDLGLGQPGDGPGILSGALPTADTVLQGIQQITPQLLALGYATGKAILPDHSGVYPPTDRMSVITYWWGFELVLPPPSIDFLGNVPSIAHAVMNFLTGLSLVNNGIREILPFIRYISQYIDSEFNMIKSQDQRQGVVCAATWIMPAALVPRPWDFPPPPVADKPSTPPDSGADTPNEDVPTPSPGTPRSGQPTLLPPPLNTDSVFVGVDGMPPIDDTPVEVTAEGTDIPDVQVIPPTPPATETLRVKERHLEEQEGRTDGGVDNLKDLVADK